MCKCAAETIFRDAAMIHTPKISKVDLNAGNEEQVFDRMTTEFGEKMLTFGTFHPRAALRSRRRISSGHASEPSDQDKYTPPSANLTHKGQQ
jgi:hypothetical protein